MKFRIVHNHVKDLFVIEKKVLCFWFKCDYDFYSVLGVEPKWYTSLEGAGYRLQEYFKSIKAKKLSSTVVEEYNSNEYHQ